MIRRPHFLFAILFAQCVTFLPPLIAKSRTWTTQNSDIEIEGELIASNSTTAILKRKGSGRLVAVELAELSEQDRQFIEKQSTENDSRDAGDAEHRQIWTSREGMKMQARIVAYGEKEYRLGNERGVVTLNGKAFSKLDPLHRSVALKILSTLENTSFENEADLRRFVSQQAGRPKTYRLQGVLMELPSGDQIAVPFFMFSDEDLVVLKAGWENWLQGEESAKASEDLMMRSEAMAYQQSAAERAEYQRMEMLKLNMLAARTGLTSIWEVQLRPNAGVYGRPVSVMVPARNSQIATEMVVPRYPGYSLIGVRKASR